MELHPTARPVSPGAETRLNEEIRVLDHGFVRLVDYMGSDAAIVQAARVSYSGGTSTVRDETGLIRYLMRHHHTTPFEMCEIKLHCKMPIFVARQWIRHRTASVNEVSARYSVLDSEFYVPAEDQIQPQSQTNKQGRDGNFTSSEVAHIQNLLMSMAKESGQKYNTLLDANLARELARMSLTLNTYTSWYWKTDLHNLFNFLKLRMDPHAQYEIRVYAEAIAWIVKQWCPVAWQAFLDYRLHAATLSAQAVLVLRRMLEGEIVPAHMSGLNRREYDDLLSVLNIDKNS